MKRTILGLGLALAVLTAAKAEAAGSNIALVEYPGPGCAKPERPAEPRLPPDETAPGAAAGYNLKVKLYNQAISGYNAGISAFNACMRTYIDNGNADLTRIKQRLDQAVADANSP